jgi:hypothetical protein
MPFSVHPGLGAARSFAPAEAGEGGGAAELLAGGDVTRLGAFRLPVSTGSHFYGLAPGQIAFKTGNQLYVPSRQTDGAGTRLVTLVEYGSLSTSTTIADLPRATLVTDGQDVLTPVYTAPYDTLGGMCVLDGDLLVQPDIYYDASGLAVDNVCVVPLALGSVAGPYRIGTFYPRLGSNGLCAIPADWQAAFDGDDALCGCAGRSIVSNSSDGPSCASFTVADVGAVDAPATQRLYYATGELDDGTGTDPVWSFAHTNAHGAAGMFFLSADSKVAIGFVIYKVTGVYWYGYSTYVEWRTDGASPFPAADDIPSLKAGQSHYATFGNATGWPATDTESRYESDPRGGGKGTKGSEWAPTLYVYHPQDILDAADVNDPQPTVIALPSTLDDLGECLGSGFDPATGRLFVARQLDSHGLDQSCLIEVYQLPNDAAAPDAPTGLAQDTATATSVTAEWTAPAGGGPRYGYRVYVDAVLADTVASSATSVELTGLDPDTTYAITVKTYGPGGESAAAGPVNMDTATAVFLDDTFTGGAGALTAHSPEIGGTWTNWAALTAASSMPTLTGDGFVRGNEAANAYVYNTAVPPSADYEVDLYIRFVTVASVTFGLLVRANIAGGSAYAVYLEGTTFKLYGATELDTYVPTFSNNTTYKLTFRVVGDVQTFLIDDVEVMSGAANTYSAAGVVSIEITAADASVVKFDRITARVIV